MKEYIERSSAVKAAQDGADEWDGGFNRNRDAYIEAAIDKVPTADVQEVQHSKWMKTYHSGVVVSEGFVSLCCDMWNERDTKFCPNCGAKMN